MNLSKSILVGDHVWLGQNAVLLKGSMVGSGSVLASHSVLANKKVESNSAYAGNPARKIRPGVFFVGKSVHNYTLEQTEKSMTYSGDEFIYEAGEQVDFEAMDKALTLMEKPERKLEVLQKYLLTASKKGRFYLPPQEEVRKKTEKRSGLFRR